VAAAEAAWDDEEEFEPPPVVTHGEAPKLSTEKEEKMKRERAAAKAADIEAALEGYVSFLRLVFTTLFFMMPS
jgi:hypothetical protein